MIRTAIVEDDPQDAQRLKSMLERFAAESGQQFQIHWFSASEPFLHPYRPCDLVFLDIELPGKNGMETARQLRRTDEMVTLIFVTNMAQYALHGYDVDALDFILKPLQYGSFSMKMKKAVRNIVRNASADLTLTTATGFARVPVGEVLYVEVQKHYLTYHTETGDYTVRQSMRAAEETLLPLHFLRCNNCYLVNLRHVTGISDNTVLVDGQPLQISRPRRAAFLKGLTDYLGGNIP